MPQTELPVLRAPSPNPQGLGVRYCPPTSPRAPRIQDPTPHPNKRRGFWAPTPRGSAAGLSRVASQGSPSAARGQVASLKLSKTREGPERPASRSWKLPWRMREAAGITIPRARASAASLTQGSAVGEFSRPSRPARISQAPSEITPSGLARPRQSPSPSSR